MLNSERGLALISALLVLAFCTVVGAAFLSSSAVEVQIAENYITNMRLRYLAEGGIEDARARLWGTRERLAEALADAGGPDQQLESSDDLDTLLVSDDRPLVVEIRPTASTPARYVFVRNDPMDGAGMVTDTNGIVTLVSIARMGDREYRAEAEVMRRPVPVAAGLMLHGAPGTVGLGNVGATFRIEGIDRCRPEPVHAIGLTSDHAATSIQLEIPTSQISAYPGVGGVPDAIDVSGELPGTWNTVSGIERFVRRIGEVATDRHASPTTTIGAIGARDDPRIVWVEGDAVLAAGEGHGVLIVRGAVRVDNGFVWNGLILAVGEGQVAWNAFGTVYGAVIVARTLDPPQGNPPQRPLRDVPGDLEIDLNGAGGGIYYDSCAIGNASRLLPVSPIAIRGY